MQVEEDLRLLRPQARAIDAGRGGNGHGETPNGLQNDLVI